MSAYTSAGRAVFKCPYIVRKLELHENIPKQERPSWDSDGHSEWAFHWLKGDWKIQHDENTIRHCSGCGAELVYVEGDNPF